MSRWSSLSLALGLAILAGCSRGGSADLSAEGRQFVLAEEPGDAIGILDYREAPPEASEVALLGRIGGAKATWSTQSAEFLISDPTHEPAAEDKHVCQDDNCPFCKGKHKVENAEAIVMLTDAAGRVPTVDARRLLPLEEGQLVVVRGQAEINPIGQLVVRASGIYVRR